MCSKYKKSNIIKNYVKWIGYKILKLTALAYHEEELPDGTTREVMKFHPYLAPYKNDNIKLVLPQFI